MKTKTKKIAKELFPVYGVFNYKEPEPGQKSEEVDYTQEKPITFVASKEEAQLALDRIVYLDHIEHYMLWCKLRELAPGFLSESWSMYHATLTEEDKKKYTLVEFKYSLQDFISILREYAECDPLFLPYESRNELDTYLDRENWDIGQPWPDHIAKILKGDPELNEEFKQLEDEVKKIIEEEDSKKTKFDA